MNALNRKIILIMLSGALSGCSTLGYYMQSLGGQLHVMSQRQPVPRLLDRPDTPDRTKTRLKAALEFRNFASAALGLPDNPSYRSYVDLQRPYAVWNVVATPAYDLAPRQWCFPVVGCMIYRGYFDQDSAQRYGDGLAAEGLDVYVYGVTAYSTLGWFDDPLLNTMLAWPDHRLAGLIFHELAHQTVYIPGDSAFNESFATVVEWEGMRRWLAAHPDARAEAAYRQERARQADFTDLIDQTRARLARAYAVGPDDSAREAAKVAVFSDLRKSYAALKQRWGGYSGYDNWFKPPLNNAKLAIVATYHSHVPAFTALLAETDGDLSAFYTAVKALGALPADERELKLAQLASAVTEGL